MTRNKCVLRTILAIVSILFLFSSCIACLKTTQVQIHTGSSGPIEPLPLSLSVVRFQSSPINAGTSPTKATGFAISPDYLITAGHFCDRVLQRKSEGIDDGRLLFDYVDMRGMIVNFTVPSEIISSSQKPDVCIVKSKGHGLVPLKLAKDTSHLISGLMVTVAGYPGGHEALHQTDGRILLIHNRIQSKIKVFPGHSGSPLLYNGEVIGIVESYQDSSLEAIRSIHNAVKVEDLRNFLKETLGDKYASEISG